MSILHYHETSLKDFLSKRKCGAVGNDYTKQKFLKVKSEPVISSVIKNLG